MTPSVLEPKARSTKAAPNLAEDFLMVVAQSILDKMDDSLFSDFAVEASTELANEIWTRWSKRSTAAQRRSTLEAVARCSFEQLDELIEGVEKTLGTGANSDLGKLLGNYLHLLPGSIRRRCKRPSQPSGLSVPSTLPLTGGEDLLPLLPARMTRFQPGDRPWAVGEWELVELLEHSSYREVWKAKNLANESAPPVALHFILHPAARSYVLKSGTAALQQIHELGNLAGVVPLQAIHLHTEPPCLQYAYVEAAHVTALVQEWRETDTTPDPWCVADLIQQLATILGRLHRRPQPIIHRHLWPGHILVTARPQGGWRCQLADLGLGPWGGSAALPAAQNPYAAPEQRRDDVAQPQDDVFALGVLWHQLLVGNLEQPRPGGSSWRRRLTRQGVPPELIETVEACFDDDVAERPADGLVLADRILKLARRPKPLTHHGTRLVPAVVNTIGMAFVPVPGGTFWMGSDLAETGRERNEFLRHEVTLLADFFLCVTPVTQRQFELIMRRNPAQFGAAQGGSPEHPVESVSWHEAEEFCQRLSETPDEVEAGHRYRLPSEAEWERACRAGTSTAYGFGALLPPSQACCAAQAPARVGRFAPNTYGLFDMHGNVWEWCADAYPGNPAGAMRVLRGGSWRSSAASCRSASRQGLPAAARADDVGFRVVLEQY
ncbi:MAG: SUMF1/EgtB/PvdO family nonheme iron enzyme [Gemmataceae bacterium]|nr:SUMF1/EgtB/PvdO family nonheme iron enzyme [Gemmataceae bacterium]